MLATVSITEETIICHFLWKICHKRTTGHAEEAFHDFIERRTTCCCCCLFWYSLPFPDCVCIKKLLDQRNEFNHLCPMAISSEIEREKNTKLFSLGNALHLTSTPLTRSSQSLASTFNRRSKWCMNYQISEQHECSIENLSVTLFRRHMGTTCVCVSHEKQFLFWRRNSPSNEWSDGRGANVNNFIRKCHSGEMATFCLSLGMYVANWRYSSTFVVYACRMHNQGQLPTWVHRCCCVSMSISKWWNETNEKCIRNENVNISFRIKSGIRAIVDSTGMGTRRIEWMENIVIS